MPREDLQFFDLADFTPGISSQYHSLTAEIPDAPQRDGFARAEGTWGCYALPTGGLAPLPAATIDRHSAITDWDGDPGEDRQWPNHDGDPDVYTHRQAILDAKVISPVTHIPPLSDPVDRTLPPVDVYMVRQLWLRRKSGYETPEPWWFLSNHLEYLGPPYTRDGAANLWVSGATAEEDLTPVDIDPSRWTYGGGSLAETRTVSPDITPYQIGSPVVVAGMGGVRRVATESTEGIDMAKYVSYPDYHETFDEGEVVPYAVPYDRPWYLPAPLGVAMPGIVFGHQGRLMGLARESGYAFARRLNYHGDDDSMRAASELVLYWPVNDIYDPEGHRRATFMEEASSGYGTWCSVNANSLLLVKNQGGGVQINGDVESPQVVRLPGLPSVGGRANRGVMTDKGFVYGTVSGVWLWGGGDAAQALSDNLDPLHWIPDDPTVPLREVSCLVGSFAHRHPFVFAPNNWVLDLRTGGWFRYHPTPDQDPTEGATFAFNEVDAVGNLWAFPASIVDQGTYCRMLDQTVPRSSWAWQSQPIAKARARYLNYRQLDIVASGRGTVQVTVTGIDGARDVATFAVDSSGPAITVEPLAINTTDVEVSVVAHAAVDGDPAPTLHRLRLGYTNAQGIQATAARTGV